MKMYLVFLLLAFQLSMVAQGLIKEIKDFQTTEDIAIPNLDKLILNRPSIRIRPPIIPVQPAPLPVIHKCETYRGETLLDIPNQEKKQIEYFISFSKKTNNCNYAFCFFGWVDNFTLAGGETVQGYPRIQNNIKPVFQFNTNSKKDFIIKRHPDLEIAFVDIIQIGCELFEPTIRTVSKSVVSTGNSFSFKPAQEPQKAFTEQFFFRKAASQEFSDNQYQYNFIPEAEFNRFQPTDTLKLDLNIFDPNQNILGRNLQGFDKEVFMAMKANIENVDTPRVASLSRRIPVSDLELKRNDLAEKIVVDRDFVVTSRERIVDINIPSTGANDQNVDFVSNIKVKFERRGAQVADNNKLEAEINNFGANSNSAFSPRQIEARRADISKIKFYNQNFQINEANLQPSVVQQKMLDREDRVRRVQKRVLQTLLPVKPKIMLDTEIAQPIQDFQRINRGEDLIRQLPRITTKPFKPRIPIDEIEPIDPVILNPPKPIDIIPVNVTPISIPNLLCTGDPKSEVLIYNYEKVLYERTIFGKSLKLSVKITASIVGQKEIRFKGVALYSLFGNQKSIDAFNLVQNIVVNYQKPFNYNGKWDFGIQIPLPPPVSFITLNFVFAVNFRLNILLYAKGAPSGNQPCRYEFNVGASLNTGLGVDASGSVRVVIIEGGAFIAGDLVNLSTQPKITAALDLVSKSLEGRISWYFNINAFRFEWGFFYRYRTIKIRWFSISISWSDRKIIAKWPITSGITQKYKIIDQSIKLNL